MTISVTYTISDTWSEMKRNFEKYSDSELMRIVLKKINYRDSAFMELYKRYSRSVYNYCLIKFFKKNTAKDYFEQSMIAFFQAIISGKEIEDVQKYLFGIVQNHLRNYIRENKKNSEHQLLDKDIHQLLEENPFFEKHFSNYHESSSIIEKNEFLKLIETAIELLSDKEQEYYRLNKFANMSASEIAKIFDENVNTVKSILYRSQSKIKQILMPYIEELK